MADFIRATDLAELLKGLATEIRGFVEHATAPIRAEQATLAKRLDALEGRRVMEFAGAHDPGREYHPGAVVQRGGGTWVCLVTTTEPPGSSPAWRRLSGASQ
jgi:hypothetical protein